MENNNGTNYQDIFSNVKNAVNNYRANGGNLAIMPSANNSFNGNGTVLIQEGAGIRKVLGGKMKKN